MAKGRRMSDMTPAPRRRPLWRLFILPVLLPRWLLWLGERVLVPCRPEPRSRPTPGAGGELLEPTTAPGATAAGFPFRLEGRWRRQRVAQSHILVAGCDAGADHRKLRQIPGGGANPTIGNRRRPRNPPPRPHFPAPAGSLRCPANWSKARSSVAGTAGPPVAGLHRVRPSPAPTGLRVSVESLGVGQHVELHGPLAHQPLSPLIP